MLLYSRARRGRPRVLSACRGSRPCRATGLGQSISWRSRDCLVVAGETDAAIPFWVHLRRLVDPDLLQLVERRFPNIDGIGCHSNDLDGFKLLQHREEIDVGVGQHRGSEMGELRLRAVVVGEDVTKLALGRRSDQNTREAGVSDKVVELAAVGHQPPCEPFSICLAALGEFADDGAALVPVFGQPNLGLLLEGDDRLADFERQEQTRLPGMQGAVSGPSRLRKCLANQAGMTGWQVASNSDSTTSAKPVPMSLGRGPLMATRAMR